MFKHINLNDKTRGPYFLCSTFAFASIVMIGFRDARKTHADLDIGRAFRDRKLNINISSAMLFLTWVACPAFTCLSVRSRAAAISILLKYKIRHIRKALNACMVPVYKFTMVPVHKCTMHGTSVQVYPPGSAQVLVEMKLLLQLQQLSVGVSCLLYTSDAADE